MTEEDKYRLFSKTKSKELLVKANKISGDISSLMALMEMIEDLNLEHEYERWKMKDFKENCIEWVTGEDKIYLTLTQIKYINKVKKLHKTHEKEVEIVENKDGSIFATLPLKALKLSIITAKGRQFPNMAKQEEQEDDD